MKKIVLFTAMLITILSCSSDNKTQDKETLAAQFIGEFSNYETSSQMEAHLVIENNNTITINFLMGKLTGTATKTEENYSFNITKAEGIFKDILGFSGEIDTFSKTLSMSGSNTDGTPATISGNINVMLTGGWENLAKSRVLFVHDEPGKLASVTINGVTHSGLNSGGYTDLTACDQLLTWTHMRGNFDSFQVTSAVSCYTATLPGLAGGPPVTYTACNSIYYILDKNTEYTYTVTWSTGETYTGQFTSLDGGGNLPICLSYEGGTGGNPDEGTGQFILDGTNYNTGCFIYTDCHTQGFCESDVHCVMLPTGNGNDNLVFYNVPKASSGTFQMDDFDNSDVCDLSGVCYISPKNYFIQSGTLTKTGANSFTFTCVLYNANNSSETKTVTGSGTY